jgi:hypothetical protein
MQIKRKLTVALAAMIVAGQINGGSVLAAPSADQISALQSHLVAGDIVTFVGLIRSNPDLLADGWQLTPLLLETLALYDQGLMTAFNLQLMADLEMAFASADAQVRNAARRAPIY